MPSTPSLHINPLVTPLRTGHRLGRLALLALMFAAALAPSSASADSSGPVSAIINVDIPIRSITVDPTLVAFANCDGPNPAALSLPNGTCFIGTSPLLGPPVGGITITNTGSPGHIAVNGFDAVPVDGGAHWAICGGIGEPCAGPSGKPGTDQFSLTTFGFTAVGETPTTARVTHALMCDLAFSLQAACFAQTGTSQTEQLSLQGPQFSTDKAARFDTVVTWTAIP